MMSSTEITSLPTLVECLFKSWTSLRVNFSHLSPGASGLIQQNLTSISMEFTLTLNKNSKHWQQLLNNNSKCFLLPNPFNNNINSIRVILLYKCKKRHLLNAESLPKTLSLTRTWVILQPPRLRAALASIRHHIWRNSSKCISKSVCSSRFNYHSEGAAAQNWITIRHKEPILPDEDMGGHRM